MSQSNEIKKKTVAVFFGGRSPEHDVSVITGLQVLQAIDPSLYDAFPVYIDPEGKWYIGEPLRQRASYLLKRDVRDQLEEVTLDIESKRGRHIGGTLLKRKKKLFKSDIAATFDIAIPAFHGLIGEDGNIQGMFETAGIPYLGMRTMASSVVMDKGVTKLIQKALNIPHLPYAVIRRPKEGYMIEEKELKSMTKHIKFPACIKPVHLGSSIGVAKVKNVEEIMVCLPPIFKFDTAAIIEPFVENLVEYNVSVSKAFGEIRTSAIERPKATSELLDFKQKYMSGGGKSGTKSGGLKNPGQISEGMLSLTRELNPELPAKTEKNIREWSEQIFDALDGTGAPRIDFIGNSQSGEIWMNEINPLPGSFGYFLWEAAEERVLFTELLTALIEEALAEGFKHILPKDPVPEDARLLRR